MKHMNFLNANSCALQFGIVYEIFWGMLVNASMVLRDRINGDVVELGRFGLHIMEAGGNGACA